MFPTFILSISILTDPLSSFISCKYNNNDCEFTEDDSSSPGSIQYSILNETATVFLLKDKCTNKNECYPYEVILSEGNWTFELWGTRGYQNTHIAEDERGNLTDTPGYGAYVKGSLLNWNKDVGENPKALYFYIGSKTGFNGGAMGENNPDRAGQGGSATDIRLKIPNDKQTWDDLSSLKSRIIVAGAGGGQEGVKGGHAGGLVAGLVEYNETWKRKNDQTLQTIIKYATGGTQTTGGDFGQTYGFQNSLNKYDTWSGQSGTFGKGGDGIASGYSDGGSGGGSGYWGGGGIGLAGGAGGGSSFISGHEGCIALLTEDGDSTEPKPENDETRSIHPSGIQFIKTEMIAGYNNMPYPSISNFDNINLGYSELEGAIRLIYIHAPLIDDPTETPTETPTKTPTEQHDEPQPETQTENLDNVSNSDKSKINLKIWIIVGSAAGAIIIAALIIVFLLKYYFKGKGEGMKPEFVRRMSYESSSSITQDNPLYKDEDNDKDDPFENDFEELSDSLVNGTIANEE